MQPPHIPKESISCSFTHSGLLELSRRCIPDKPQQRWENLTSPQRFPLLSSSSFPSYYVTDNKETQKRLDPGKSCPDASFQPSPQTPWCDPHLSHSQNPVEPCQHLLHGYPGHLRQWKASPCAIPPQIWTLQCLLEHPELSAESLTNTLIAFNLSASNHSV